MKRGKCRRATKGARPPRRRRWQTKSDGEGASAAEVKWILRLKILTILAFPSGESVAESDERGQNESGSKARNGFNVKDLSRLLLAPLSKSTLPIGESKEGWFFITQADCLFKAVGLRCVLYSLFFCLFNVYLFAKFLLALR